MSLFYCSCDLSSKILCEGRELAGSSSNDIFKCHQETPVHQWPIMKDKMVEELRRKLKESKEKRT